MSLLVTESLARPADASPLRLSFRVVDPAVLARYEGQGRSVTVTESSNVTLELKGIPAAAAR
jgi:hypothetical protein